MKCYHFKHEAALGKQCADEAIPELAHPKIQLLIPKDHVYKNNGTPTTEAILIIARQQWLCSHQYLDGVWTVIDEPGKLSWSHGGKLNANNNPTCSSCKSHVRGHWIKTTVITHLQCSYIWNTLYGSDHHTSKRILQSWKKVPKKATKTIRGLARHSYEERLQCLRYWPKGDNDWDF